jgi:hypothetical protein
MSARALAEAATSDGELARAAQAGEVASLGSCARRPVIAAVTAEAEAGQELHLTRVLASGRVTVLEARFPTYSSDPRRGEPIAHRGPRRG